MPDPLRLDLPVLLPDAPDARDACVTRLTDALAATSGVERAHVVPAEGGRPAQLCLHYDPSAVALPRLRRAAQAAGARITERYGHVLWPADGLGHQRRARTVTELIQKTPGVVEAEANATGPVRIEFAREATSEADLRRWRRHLGQLPDAARQNPRIARVPALGSGPAGHTARSTGRPPARSDRDRP